MACILAVNARRLAVRDDEWQCEGMGERGGCQENETERKRACGCGILMLECAALHDDVAVKLEAKTNLMCRGFCAGSQQQCHATAEGRDAPQISPPAGVVLTTVGRGAGAGAAGFAPFSISSL